MLKEIRSKMFAQQVIQFHMGLNVIAGDDNATNSIGKTSALLAIEFAMGGKTYAAQEDMVQNVGHHDVFFCYTFDGADFYFKRNTAMPNTVYKCNEQYEVIEEYSLDKFCQFLLLRYGIHHKDLTFRNFVGLFSRIYGKQNLDETQPLHAIKNEGGSSAITRLIKIFDEYALIEEQKNALQDAKEQFDVFKLAQKKSLISPTLGQNEKKLLEKELKDCDASIEAITSQLVSQSVNLDNQKMTALTRLRMQQDMVDTMLQKQKSRFIRLQRSLHSAQERCIVDTAQLSTFFPSINIKEVDKINKFHLRLSEILNSRIKEDIKDCQLHIMNYQTQSDAIIAEIKAVVDGNNPTVLAVNNLMKIKTRQEEIMQRLKNTEFYHQYSVNEKNARELYSSILLNSLTTIQQKINNELQRLSDIVSPGRSYPQFSLDGKSYRFFINNDTGAGSKYKGTILSDISFMNITDLPFLIHDSILFKNIEDYSLDNILSQYVGFKDKQVFIAFDRINTYSQKAQEILNKGTVVKIEPGGKEFFGRSWNLKG